MDRLPLLFFFSALCGALAAERDGAWHLEKGARWRPLPTAPETKSGFALLPPEATGVTFSNPLDFRQRAENRTLDAGSGVAAGDIDGDRLPELFFPSLTGKHALYKNLGGWKFADITADAGIRLDGEVGRGAVFADVDGDGALDLLVSAMGRGVFVLRNDGRGHFTDITGTAGTASRFASMTLALADVNGDGALDLYVANNRVEDIRDRGQTQLIRVEGKLTVPSWQKNRFTIDEESGKVLEYGEPDALYFSDGAGRFTPVSWTDGAFLDADGHPLEAAPLDWGLGVTFRDFDGDRAPDLYVCNDYWTPDRVYRNDGRGRFRELSSLALRHTSFSSMGVDFADLDRDGHADGFVVDMLGRAHATRLRQMSADLPTPKRPGQYADQPQIARNTLLRNQGDGTFVDLADYAGLSGTEWSWQPLFLDIDLDGFEDLIVSAGHIKDVQDLDANEKIDDLKRRGELVPRTFSLGFDPPKTRQEQFTAELFQSMLHYPPLDAPLVAYRNRGDWRFDEMTGAWGLNTPGVHHGMASADLDGDGDLDLVVNNLNAIAGLYRNESSAPRVAVRLKGRPPNTQGIGAKIVLRHGALPVQSQEVVSGGRYLSGCDPLLVFAAGKAAAGMILEVAWRDGKTSTVTGIAPNRLYEIEEELARPAAPVPAASRPDPLFVDRSDLLGHVHHENDFDDFARQPLLPNRLSRLGPGVAWHDFNGDQRPDLIVGTGAGGRRTVLLNDRQTGFVPASGDPLALPALRDQSGLAAWTRADGTATLLSGSANFEDGDPGGAAVERWDFRHGSGRPEPAIPGGPASVGPIALADLEGRGELTLFVGGRVVPGEYPAAASSRIFRERDGQFVLDQKASASFAAIGLVSGALFSDLNSDGFPDLVLALEWGPLRIFLNQRGQFREATAELGFVRFAGWWNGIAAGDFNEDGRIDLLATNWGLNNIYQQRRDPAHPLQILYGDFNGDGTTRLVECHYDRGLGRVVAGRGLNPLRAVMPWLREVIPGHAAFSVASVAEILGPRFAGAKSVSANTLAHTLFLNRGGHFDAVPLPRDAQLAPAFGVSVADFDGDGHEDAFLAQNHFSAQPEVPRCDAGRGMLLRGDGKGGLSPLSSESSGIAIFGEGRGCAAADYDGDRRTDLAVAQNGAATRLYQNGTARPGVRVQLRGRSGNRDGIGAQLRLIFPRRRGPVRELHAGGGYWSQDSLVPILAIPEKPAAVWVRWPGGQITTKKIPSGTTEIIIEKGK